MPGPREWRRIALALAGAGLLVGATAAPGWAETTAPRPATDKVETEAPPPPPACKTVSEAPTTKCPKGVEVVRCPGKPDRIKGCVR